MISFSHNEYFGTLFLGPLLLVGIFAIGAVIYKVLGNILKIVNEQIEFRRRLKEVKAMKDRGEHHDWVLMAVNSRMQAPVCSKTGWCPEIYAFFEPKYVQNIKKERIHHNEYLKYREQRIEEIGQQYGISSGTVWAICNQIIELPKEFHVKKLDNLHKELKATADKVNEF